MFSEYEVANDQVSTETFRIFTKAIFSQAQNSSKYLVKAHQQFVTGNRMKP